MGRHYQALYPSSISFCCIQEEKLLSATPRDEVSFSQSMVILISSTSTVAESVVKNASPTLIMEDTVGYVSLQERDAQETEQILVIHEVRLLPDPPGSSTKKTSGTCKKKVILALMIEDEEAKVEIQLPNDIPPKLPNALMDRLTRMQSIHW